MLLGFMGLGSANFALDVFLLKDSIEQFFNHAQIIAYLYRLYKLRVKAFICYARFSTAHH